MGQPGHHPGIRRADQGSEPPRTRDYLHHRHPAGGRRMTDRPLARVLVVDDEPSVLETIAAILRREGYTVAAASTVEEAIEHLQGATFDVALTDLRLEGASGLNLLAALRRQWPHIVTVVLTGYASLQSA